MPKLKQPATLERLAVQALGRAVGQRAVEAIASGVNINTSALQDYLYGELPDVLSQEVSAHMLAEVAGTLTNGDYRWTDVSDTTKRVLLAIVCHRIRVLDLTNNTPTYVVNTLSHNLHTFRKLQTFILRGCYLSSGATESLAAGLNSLKCLEQFEMSSACTDAIVQALGWCSYATLQHIDVRFSKQVTDASFKALLECRDLKHFSICDTSVTAEGFVQFLKHRKYDVTAKGFLGLGVGSEHSWNVSSRQLNVIALCCPALKYLEIYALRGDMEELVRLTKLVALKVYLGQFDKCNFNGFLRVRGCNITSLELHCTQSIDLACILNHCACIRRLFVQNGSIIGNSETDPKACQYLETLRLRCKFSPSSIEGVLYACVNLTSLGLHPYVEHITDQFLLRVLSKNPLQKLTSFTASCPELSVRAVDAIIEQCPLLEELQCFNCDRMTKTELKILKQKIKNRNQDLKADFSGRHLNYSICY